MAATIRCLYDDLVPVAKLRAHPKNRNQHPDEQIERLAKLIAYQGVRAPIVVSKRSGYIVKGHGTLGAIKKCGGKDAPVVYQEFNSEEQEYAFIQSDNAIASWAGLDLAGINADLGDLGPDFNLDMLGIKDFTLDVEVLEPQCDEDEVGEAPAEPVTKRGDIYQLGRHRLMCGSSASMDDLSRLLCGARADLVFTSPPYGVGLDYNSYDDRFENTRQVVEDVLVSVAQVVDGYIALNWGDIVSGREINKTEFPSQFSWMPVYNDILNKLGFYLWSQRIWKKPHARVSAPWTALSNRAATDWEYLFTWTNGAHKYSDRDHGSHFGIVDSSDEKQTNTLEKHPGAFPVFVSEKMVMVHTAPGARVLEPFCGTGTTLIACEKTGRDGFGMEIDPHYCDIAVARWEKYTGQKAVLLTASEGDHGAA